MEKFSFPKSEKELIELAKYMSEHLPTISSKTKDIFERLYSGDNRTVQPSESITSFIALAECYLGFFDSSR